MLAVAVDRRSCRLAPLERSEGLGRWRYARCFEPRRGLFESEGRASLEQGYEEQAVVIRVWAAARRFDPRDRDPERGAVRVVVRHSGIFSEIRERRLRVNRAARSDLFQPTGRVLVEEAGDHRLIPAPVSIRSSR